MPDVTEELVDAVARVMAIRLTLLADGRNLSGPMSKPNRHHLTRRDRRLLSELDEARADLRKLLDA